MRGRVSLFLLLLSLSFPAIACLWQPQYSAQFRATVYDVAVDSQNVVWIATGWGVQTLEPRTGGGLAAAGERGLPGTTRVVTVANGYAYAGSGSRVYILRRAGRELEVVNTIEIGATVNDVVAHSSYLFVATSNGIAHYDAFDPKAPLRTPQIVSSTKPTVTSLALNGTTLYAADGDSTIEIINVSNPALPQKTGTLESHARAAAVHASGTNVIVSDDFGQNTDIFTGTARIARFAYGSTAFAPLSANRYFVGGARTLRALDVTTPTRIAEVFEQALAPTGGTNNRIYAMTRSGNTLYVAAGDIGLLSYDVTSLATRQPLASYSDGTKTSALIIGTKAYFSDATSIHELNIDTTGLRMSVARTWATTTASILQDHATTRLVVSTGSDVKLWSIDTPTPAITFSVTFPVAVRSAVLANNHIVAVLTDGSVWRAPAAGGPPQKMNFGDPAEFLARDGNAVAIAQVSEAGNTTIRYFATGDLVAQPRLLNVEGTAVGGLGLSATHAAVFTFKGLSVVDLASGATRTFADSLRSIPKRLFISGNSLLTLGTSSLAVWDIPTGTQSRQHTLPADGSTLHAAANLAVIAGTSAIAIDYGAAQPAGTPHVSNVYYTKVVANGSDLYLFGDNRVDAFGIHKGAAPRFVANVSAPGVIDLAALPQSFATLSSFSVVTTYSSAGAQLAQVTLNEGADAEPLAIFAAGNALWVSFTKGCQTGTCVKSTLILDPKTLAVTATINGGVIDVVTSGTRAYALFSIPDQNAGTRGETRVYDISSPLQPSPLATVASEDGAASIGFFGGFVYVLAARVHEYSEALVKTRELLSSSPSEDARMRIEAGGCAILIGRGEHPEFWGLPSWGQLLIPTELPSPARTMAVLPGRVYFLTDHSLEVWMAADPPPPSKRRAVR